MIFNLRPPPEGGPRLDPGSGTCLSLSLCFDLCLRLLLLPLPLETSPFLWCLSRFSFFSFLLFFSFLCFLCEDELLWISLLLEGVELDCMGMLTSMDLGSSLGNLIELQPSLSFSKPVISSTLLSLTAMDPATLGSFLISGFTSSSPSEPKTCPNSCLILGSAKVEDVIEAVGGACLGGLSMSKMDFGGFIEVTGLGGIGGGGGRGFGGSLGGNGGCC